MHSIMVMERLASPESYALSLLVLCFLPLSIYMSLEDYHNFLFADGSRLILQLGDWLVGSTQLCAVILRSGWVGGVS